MTSTLWWIVVDTLLPWIGGTALVVVQLVLNSIGWSMFLSCVFHVISNDKLTFQQRLACIAVVVFLWKVWWRVAWWLFTFSV
jgi:hypothetical protein